MIRKIAFLILTLLLLLTTCLQTEISLQAENKDRDTSYRSGELSSTQSTVHHSGLPKVDTIYYKAYPGASPDIVVEEFLAGETDWIEGPSRSDLYENVTAAGHKVSPMDPEAEFSFIVINCRDYKNASGESNLPLNDSNFRIALSYIYGVDSKQADIYDYYKVDWMYAIGNPVPAAQGPWYNASIQMPDTNWTKAWSILQSSGYYINSTENWLYRNGEKIRNLTVLYSGCGGGPYQRFNIAFNNFITTHLGADGPTMAFMPDDFTGMITDLLVDRNFDFIGIGLTNMGRYVDWLYDCLHSDTDIPWGWNFGGIHDPDFDRWTEIILTSLDAQEIIDAASKIQEKFVYELLPWIPIVSGSDFCTTVRDERGELMNIVSMPNFGPRNDWSWMTMHWRGEPDVAWPGGTVIAALGDEPDTMNPWTEDTLYGWELIGRALLTGETGLLGVSPTTCSNMPFVATDWEVSHLASMPEFGIVNGCRCTFWLRQDITWHDGRPVTAYDCVENLRFMREHEPGRYEDVWRDLVYEEAEGLYKFNVYFNQSSLYCVDYVAERSLLVPEHIIEVVEDYWRTWMPCDNATRYAGLGLGPPSAEYPFMTQLVGCGPYVFDYYDRRLATGHVTRYNDFFVSAPVIGSVVGEWRTDLGANYTYHPLVQNLAAMEANENGTLVSVVVDVKVFEAGVLVHEVNGLVLDPWNWTYLGPYTMESVACGLHNITVEIYDHADLSLLHNYTHAFTAAIREDLTTCSGEVIDFKVDMRDIGRVASAFGSFPGHPRWDSVCDVNHDFKVDMRDVGSISRRFGWHC